jgi:hypothetical protein
MRPIANQFEAIALCYLIEAVQVGVDCYLTTLKRCLGVLCLHLGQPGSSPRTFDFRAGEPNCAKISGKLY